MYRCFNTAWVWSDICQHVPGVVPLCRKESIMIRYCAVCVLVMVMSAAAFARSGDKTLSAGVFGQYAIDGGPVEDAVAREESRVYNMPQWNTSKENPIVAGGGAYVRYLFDNGIFFRAGAENHKLIKDVKTNGQYYMGMERYTSEISYSAIAIPAYVGIKIFEKNNDIGVYAAAGFVYGKIKYSIHRSENRTSVEYYSDVSVNENMFGAAALFGLEKTFFKSINVGIEYALYRCEKKYNRTKLDYYTSGFPSSYVNSNPETIGLPRHLIRMTVSYNIF
jgi:opacity protein-like surface antigen